MVYMEGAVITSQRFRFFIAPPLPTNPYLCAIYGKETVQGAVQQLSRIYLICTENNTTCDQRQCD